MISIQSNIDNDFNSIRAIAHEVWPIVYRTILSQEQLEYMMEMIYSISSLQKQANEFKNHFIIATENETPVGFASYELNYNQTLKTKIHKIYILSHQQGKGTGKLLMDYILNQAKQNFQEALLLNVNKYNTSRFFYEKLGFTLVGEEIIDIGNGYVMDDFIMEYLIKNN